MCISKTILYITTTIDILTTNAIIIATTPMSNITWLLYNIMITKIIIVENLNRICVIIIHFIYNSDYKISNLYQRLFNKN
jgi:hypothetical protein